ncbi:MAG: polyphosphate:AMP phosphotransferase [Polyangiaceae bacterium]|nr:polyphosphate:AMP phosphotransferase [Polyangiaceae bacterium]MCW5790391.1 polyphosphate:AMP phosphotransferase [Polyangiaceae bacterium]
MFETAELGRTLSKEQFNERVPVLRDELLKAQRELLKADFPVFILLNGVDGAGKGETANLLNEWLDARLLETHAFEQPTEADSQRPRFWRYWLRTPPRGKIGIYIGNWYTQPIITQVLGHGSAKELARQLAEIRQFEQALVDDGALIVKFWFHLSKAQQKARLSKLESDSKTSWRVTKEDWRRFKRYEEFRRVSELALRDTSTGEAPWTVVEGADARSRSVTVGEELLSRLREHLTQRGAGKPPEPAPDAHSSDPLTILDRIDLSQSLEKRDYEPELERQQARLNKLSRKVRRQGKSVIVAFEGWDAAGKGGAIRRVIHALDARQFRVIPISAPSPEERAHHYLWRFWRDIPGPGRFTIYDRSWYGRVLVERVEGFATRAEWRRAYGEINEFERQLTRDGRTALIKVWLHISPEEQLRRFQEREQTPYKAHKIGPEDYRNREKWAAYEAAADAMVSQTSTRAAPWTLVPAECKYVARLRVLEAISAGIEGVLD